MRLNNFHGKERGKNTQECYEMHLRDYQISNCYETAAHKKYK